MHLMLRKMPRRLEPHLKMRKKLLAADIRYSICRKELNWRTRHFCFVWNKWNRWNKYIIFQITGSHFRLCSLSVLVWCRWLLYLLVYIVYSCFLPVPGMFSHVYILSCLGIVVIFWSHYSFLLFRYFSDFGSVYSSGLSSCHGASSCCGLMSSQLCARLFAISSSSMSFFARMMLISMSFSSILMAILWYISFSHLLL